jgi:hypothetical protein
MCALAETIKCRNVNKYLSHHDGASADRCTKKPTADKSTTFQAEF